SQTTGRDDDSPHSYRRAGACAETDPSPLRRIKPFKEPQYEFPELRIFHVFPRIGDHHQSQTLAVREDDIVIRSREVSGDQINPNSDRRDVVDSTAARLL